MIVVNREALGGVIERVVAREQLELVHWELKGPPGRQELRVYIDKPSGVTLDDCESVSNQIGAVLDVEDLIPSRYTLQVSSPGVERGLYKRADYERFAGSRVRLKTVSPINGQSNFRGKLLGLKDNSVHIEVDGAGPMEIPLAAVARANIEYKF